MTYVHLSVKVCLLAKFELPSLKTMSVHKVHAHANTHTQTVFLLFVKAVLLKLYPAMELKQQATQCQPSAANTVAQK